jgi:hypothetical protein
VNFTYTGTRGTTYSQSSTPPSAVGSYTVVGTVSNTNYTGTGSGTLTISPASATVTIGSQTKTYTGSAISATATTNPTGLTVNFTYTGTGGTTYGPSATAPTNAGTYSVAGSISNTNYTGTGSGTLTISPASVNLSFTSVPMNETYGNAAFTVTAADSGGLTSTGAVTYSVTSGPASIVSTTGVVTLSGSGTVYLKASQAASGNYAAATATASIIVYSTMTLPAASASVPGSAILGGGYTSSISVTGGSGNYSWKVTGLPNAGFTYFTNGSLMGISATPVPSTAQTISFTVQVTDTVTGNSTSAIQYSIVVAPQTPLVLQPASLTALPGAITGESYTNSSISLSGGSLSGYVFTVTGSGVASVTSSSWTLPDGLTANSSGRYLIISGKPNAVSPITLDVSATDGAGDTVGPYYYSIALSNPTPLSLPSAGALTSAVIGQSYSNAITVTGGDQISYTWTVNGTTLISGTALPIADGISVLNTGGSTLSINGPATTYGTVTLNVTVLDVGTGRLQSAGAAGADGQFHSLADRHLQPIRGVLLSWRVNLRLGRHRIGLCLQRDGGHHHHRCWRSRDGTHRGRPDGLFERRHTEHQRHAHRVWGPPAQRHLKRQSRRPCCHRYVRHRHHQPGHGLHRLRQYQLQRHKDRLDLHPAQQLHRQLQLGHGHLRTGKLYDQGRAARYLSGVCIYRPPRLRCTKCR